MPATYRVRGKGSESNRKRSWMPEPQPKSKPKQYFILGMEVNHSTYHEFMYNREYRIDGDILKDIVCWLPMLERYATEEHAKERPIEAANARKLLDQIREEIATINGKDDKNMKDPKNPSEFIKALQDIYNESRSNYTAMQKAVDDAKAKMDQANKDMQDPNYKNKKMAEAKRDIARGELRLAEDARWREYQDLLSDHTQKVKELREQFAAYLDEFYASSPDALDAATMQLLGSGICTASDLARLAERHAANPTMLRIVGEYARKLREGGKLSRDAEEICFSVMHSAAAAKDGSRELSIFDSAADVAGYGLDKNYTHATRMDTHVSEWFAAYAEQIKNLSVVSEETES